MKPVKIGERRTATRRLAWVDMFVDVTNYFYKDVD
jgi:hypothetical protein